MLLRQLSFAIKTQLKAPKGIHSALRFLTVSTIPDCRTKQHSRYFLLTFILSVIWICFYSYILVWMITIIGQ